MHLNNATSAGLLYLAAYRVEGKRGASPRTFQRAARLPRGANSFRSTIARPPPFPFPLAEERKLSSRSFSRVCRRV